MLVGCFRMRARKELQRLSQIEICIPADLEVYCEGRSVDTLTDGHIGAIKQIIYYDSTGCSSCQINHLAMTESLFTQDSTGRFTPILLFVPGRGQYDNVVKSLKERAFPFPVFIDWTNEFIRRNDPILADTRFQSFLLDRNNRIVLMAIRCPAMPCRRCSNRHWRICSPTTGNMFPKTDGHDRQTLDFAAVRRRDGRSGRASAWREP